MLSGACRGVFFAALLHLPLAPQALNLLMRPTSILLRLKPFNVSDYPVNQDKFLSVPVKVRKYSLASHAVEASQVS